MEVSFCFILLLIVYAHAKVMNEAFCYQYSSDENIYMSRYSSYFYIFEEKIK